MNDEIAGQPPVLVCFLGTGNYQETVYTQPGNSDKSGIRSRFCQVALVNFYNPARVIVLCTKKAEDTWYKTLHEELKLQNQNIEVEKRTLEAGEGSEILWQQFRCLDDTLQEFKNSPLLLDITHGFRSQPFFSAAAIFYRFAMDSLQTLPRIFYGSFNAEAKTNEIWDLSGFSELVEWTIGLRSFMTSGDSKQLTHIVKQIQEGRKIRGQKGNRQVDESNFNPLIKILQSLGPSLQCVRTGDLLLPKNAKRNRRETGEIEVFLTVLKGLSEELERDCPPLSNVVEQIEHQLKPMIGATSLSGRDGLKVLHNLAEFYFDQGRYIESATTLREAWINVFYEEEDCIPGEPFSMEKRKEYEDKAKNQDANYNRYFDKIGQVRNDLDHAGYSKSPNDGGRRISHLKELLKEFPAKVEKALG
jgi:CRISPR-associated protein Csx16